MTLYCCIFDVFSLSLSGDDDGEFRSVIHMMIYDASAGKLIPDQGLY